MDSVGTAVRRAVQSWSDEVKRRRRVTGVDPVADALDYCAAEILSVVKEAEDADRWCGVREYAARVGKSEATVRKWIRAGQIRAEKDAGGEYRIHLGAGRIAA